MGMARLLGFCIAFLFASSVTAANIIDLGPSDYRNWGTGTNTHTPQGLRSATGQTVRLPPLNTNLPVSRNAVVPYNSLANGMRNFVRINPASVAASAAVTGLFLAVDWVWDEAAQTWGKTEMACPDGYICDVESGISVSYCTGGVGGYNLTEQTFHATFDRSFNGFPVGTLFSISTEIHENDGPVSDPPNRFVSRCQKNQFPELNGTLSSIAAYLVVTPITSPNIGDPEPTFIDLDPSDWSELAGYLPSASADQVGSAGNDTQRKIGGPLPGYTDQTITGPSSVSGPDTTSTTTDPVTGDTIVTNTSTTTNISYGDTTITTTNTTTSTTYQNGQETGTTVTTETPGELPVESGGGGASGDWPGFCDWATVVCDWLDWTREDPPPEQDLPAVIDDDFYQEKQISFGSKSCPEPYAISLAPFMDTTVGVSFQPLCDFAGLIYYMVMAASYIIAAYISIGVARNA